uniref:DUF4240 domain-containing protein n=1 Tax=Steinernema glaseri TaxID=37863 RepID=A0A1I7ZEY0_9BILA
MLAYKSAAFPDLLSSLSEYLSPDEFSSSYSYHDFKRFLALLISEKEFTNAPLLRRLALYEYVHARGEKSDSYFLFEQSRQMIADKHFHTKTWQYVMDLEPTRNNVWLLEYPMQDVLKQCFFEATHEYNEAFCNRLAQYVLRFATKGQPTDGGCNPENPSWPSLKSEKRDYLLVLKEDGQVEWDFDYHKRAAAFWTDLIPAMSKLELAGKRENPFEEVPDLTAYEEEDDVQLWHTLEQPDLTEEKVLNDMPLHFDL